MPLTTPPAPLTATIVLGFGRPTLELADSTGNEIASIDCLDRTHAERIISLLRSAGCAVDLETVTTDAVRARDAAGERAEYRADTRGGE